VSDISSVVGAIRIGNSARALATPAIAAPRRPAVYAQSPPLGGPFGRTLDLESKPLGLACQLLQGSKRTVVLMRGVGLTFWILMLGHASPRYNLHSAPN